MFILDITEQEHHLVIRLPSSKIFCYNKSKAAYVFKRLYLRQLKHKLKKPNISKTARVT